MQRIAEVRGVPLESLAGYRKLIAANLLDGTAREQHAAWNQRQTYIAFGNFVTCAALLGIDTCPMEGIDSAKYDEILGLTERGFATGAACPAGYRAAGDPYATHPKVRFSTEQMVEYI